MPLLRCRVSAGAAITLYHALCLAKQILEISPDFALLLHPGNRFIRIVLIISVHVYCSLQI